MRPTRLVVLIATMILLSSLALSSASAATDCSGAHKLGVEDPEGNCAGVYADQWGFCFVVPYAWFGESLYVCREMR